MSFDIEQAKKFLQTKQQLEKQQLETTRQEVFKKTTFVLKNLLNHTNVEVFLVGSIIHPYQFHSKSDIDIVLKNFHGDRFELWTKLEKDLHRNVEIILFEHCSFQDHVIKLGYKVL